MTINIQERDHTLYEKIVAAVGENFPDSTQTVSRQLKTFSGRIENLRSFVNKFGYDVLSATRQLQLRQVIWRTPEEISDEGIALTDTRRRVKNQLLIYQSLKKPEMTWTSGYDGIMTFINPWGTDAQREQLQAKPDKVRTRQERATLETIIEKPLEIPPSFVDTELQARMNAFEKRLRAKYRVKEAAFNKKIDVMQRIIAGMEAIPSPDSQTMQSPQITGLWKWYDNKLADLPTHIRDIYTQFRSPYIILEQDEYDSSLSSLLHYAALHRFVPAKAIIGNFLDDIKYIIEQPENPQLKEFSLPDLRPLNKMLSEEIINLVMAQMVFDLAPLDQVRLRLNGNVYAHYQTDIDRVIQSPLAKAFLDDGRLKKKAIKSTPKTISAEFPQVGRKYLNNIRDYLFVSTASQTPKKMQKALGIAQYKTLIENLVITSRLWQAKNLSPNSNYLLTEQFSARYGMEWAMFTEVLKEHPLGLQYYQKNSKMIDDALSTRLIPHQIIKELTRTTPYTPLRTKKETTLFDYLTSYTRATDHKDLIDDYNFVVNHPLHLSTIRLQHIPKYLSPEKLKECKATADVKPLLEGITGNPPIDKKHLTSEVYDITDTKSISIRATPIKDANITITTSPVIILDPDKIAKKYTQVTQEQINKLKFLTSFKAKDQLAGKGLGVSDNDTWRTANQWLSPGDYVSRNIDDIIKKYISS